MSTLTFAEGQVHVHPEFPANPLTPVPETC